MNTEEYLDGYTNLETFVSSQPESKLTSAQTLHIFHQLVSVVRSALHEPIQIAHRDIKPENILIHPITLRIILLDFGLATHFSAREARLTTCCGSPAFHAPELVKSLKSPPGSVRYWGPEIDIWTIGVTVLRCISGVKYPLGVQHTSLQHLADKTIDAVLSVKDRELRGILAGLLDMDGEKRMDFFRNQLPLEIDQIPFKTLDTEEAHDYLISSSTASTSHHPATTNGTGAGSSMMNGYNRQFKNTTFIETQPKHSLSLILASPSNSATQSGIQDLPFSNQENGGIKLSSFLRSRSHSRDRLALATGMVSAGLELSAVDERLTALNRNTNTNGSSSTALTSTSNSLTPTASTSTPSTPELILLNPQGEPAMRAISYVKYAFRCAGILYHCQAPSDDLSQDKPSSSAPRENLGYPILHCVRLVTAKETEKSPATSSLLNQFRPPLTRAATMGAAAARSVSQPPSRHTGKNASTKNGKGDDQFVKCAEFWVQIVPVYAVEKNAPSDAQSDAVEASTTTQPKERSASRKRRPNNPRSRNVSSTNIHNHNHNHRHHRHHHHTHYEDPRRCTKLRIRISDDSQIEVIKKALAGSSTEPMTNYAMYATPPPRRPIPLPGSKKSSTTTTTTSEEDTETSLEEDADRGRTKLSRSRSNEKTTKSRSRTRTRTAKDNTPAYTAPLASNGMKDNYIPSAMRGDGLTPQPVRFSKKDSDEEEGIVNGLLEVRLDSEEEAKLASHNSNNNNHHNTKRGFFDFVSAFNIRSKPTGIATAPSTPAAIPEELEQLDPSTQSDDDDKRRKQDQQVKVAAVAVAPM